MELEVKGSKKKLTVSESAFGRDFNEALVHQVVTAYLAGARAGTKAQKTRSDVRGGGRKPWRQKGTGMARAGTIRSPLWRGGGATFAARPRDHSQKVNRKMYRGAMSAILSELLRQDRLIVVPEFKVSEPRTKAALAELDKVGVERGLIVVEETDESLALAVRNLPHVEVAVAKQVDPVSLVAAEHVVMTVGAVEKIQEWLS